MAKRKGEKYKCEECGLVVVVDDACGCSECDLICCGAAMKPVKEAKPKAKKQTGTLQSDSNPQRKKKKGCLELSFALA
jgi:hypothetical protein